MMKSFLHPGPGQGLLRAWLPALCTALSLALPLPTHASQPNAVRYNGATYVALPAIVSPDFLNGQSELRNWGRDIVVTWPEGGCIVYEGGDRLQPEGGTTVPLERPVLVLEGVHYLEAEQSARLLGLSYEPGPPPVLRSGERTLPLTVKELDLPWRHFRVEDLRPASRSVELRGPLPVWSSLDPSGRNQETLSSGTALLIRREMKLNGRPYVLLTRNDPSLESYLAEKGAVEEAVQDSPLSGTLLGRLREKMSRMAPTGIGICHGPRQELAKTVAVTVDLCWSLRPFDREFFDRVGQMGDAGQTPSVTIFVSGRWIEQHPEEMQQLIDLDSRPGVDILWAQHSWAHPKSGQFMNAWDEEQIETDTLRVEERLLEWGLVPSIYYRFPGLIHDETRLRKILSMDLLAIDCDSWVSMMDRHEPPNRLPAADGSILLLHGNGNEPRGHTRFQEWLNTHADWKWGRLNRFISDQDEGSTGTAR